MVLPSDINKAVEYYKELLLYQYQNQTKAMGTIDLLVRSILSELIPLDVMNSFNIDTAVGTQLDILGQYIGLSRRVAIIPVRNFWTLADYQLYNPLTPHYGLLDYTDSEVNKDSIFYTYFSENYSLTDLDDSDYRAMLKLKIALNNIDNSLLSIATVLYDFFGDKVIMNDLTDMTISYSVTPDKENIIVMAYQLGLIPKPQGVGISCIYRFYAPLFAFSDSAKQNYELEGFSDSTIGFNGNHFLQSFDKII